MKPLFSALFILILSKSSAQDLDSLTVVARTLASDTERVNLYYENGFKFRNKDPEFAFICAKQGEKCALQSNSKKHLARVYNLLGVLHYKKGNYKTALTHHFKALRLRRECNDLIGIAHSETNIGNVFSDLQDYSRAEGSYLNALQIYRRLNDNERIVSVLSNLGTVKHELKQYDAAIQNYTMAISLLKENDYNNKSIILTNIAQAYIAKGSVEKCIASNEDALKLRILSENNVETADNYLNLGGAHLALKEYGKAKSLIDTALHIAGSYDYAELKHKASRVMALYYSEVKDFEKAFMWMKKHNDESDSLSMQKQEMEKIFDFDEEQTLNLKASAYHFPYLYLNVLLGMTFLIGLILFKFKR